MLTHSCTYSQMLTHARTAWFRLSMMRETALAITGRDGSGCRLPPQGKRPNNVTMAWRERRGVSRYSTATRHNLPGQLSPIDDQINAERPLCDSARCVLAGKCIVEQIRWVDGQINWRTRIIDGAVLYACRHVAAQIGQDRKLKLTPDRNGARSTGR